LASLKSSGPERSVAITTPMSTSTPPGHHPRAATCSIYLIDRHARTGGTSSPMCRPPS
jgi:hypothetical protein